MISTNKELFITFAFSNDGFCSQSGPIHELFQTFFHILDLTSDQLFDCSEIFVLCYSTAADQV